MAASLFHDVHFRTTRSVAGRNTELSLVHGNGSHRNDPDKETYIIHLGCALIALPLAYVSTLIIPAEGSKPAPQKWNAIDLAVVCLTGIGAIVFFYSGTFFHWNGLKDLFKTFHAWFETGST